MYVGIDIGGTLIRLVASDSLDRPVFRNRREFANSHFFENDLKNITDYIDNLNYKIEGIGISIPGTVSEDKSMVIRAINTPEFAQKPLKKLLTEKYQCPVRLDNDGIVMALGEVFYGHGKNIDFTFIIWGTGIGGATVKYEQGKPTIIKLDRNKYKYLYLWEKECGGRSIQRHYHKPAQELSEADWQEVMESFSKYLTILVNDLKPKRVIFGGGIAPNQFARLHRVYDQLTKAQISISIPAIEVSKLGKDAGLYGALGLLE